eukprot:gene22931-13649_t
MTRHGAPPALLTTKFAMLTTAAVRPAPAGALPAGWGQCKDKCIQAVADAASDDACRGVTYLSSSGVGPSAAPTAAPSASEVAA